MSHSAGGVSDSLAIPSLQIDMTGTDFKHGTQIIGTSEEAIDLGEVAAGGFCLLINRDATNYIEVRPNTGVADLIYMGPGEPAFFRITSDAVPYAIADTDSCLLEVYILDA